MKKLCIVMFACLLFGCSKGQVKSENVQEEKDIPESNRFTDDNEPAYVPVHYQMFVI